LLQPGGVNALKALGMEGKAAKATLGWILTDNTI
jgi:hypothetical protein